jgi:hypothetical protein
MESVCEDIVAVDPDAAGIRQDLSKDHTDHRAFPGAIMSEQSADASTRDFQVQSGNREAASERFREIR